MASNADTAATVTACLPVPGRRTDIRSSGAWSITVGRAARRVRPGGQRPPGRPAAPGGPSDRSPCPAAHRPVCGRADGGHRLDRVGEEELASGRFVLLHDRRRPVPGRASGARSPSRAPSWSPSWPATRCSARSAGPGWSTPWTRAGWATSPRPARSRASSRRASPGSPTADHGRDGGPCLLDAARRDRRPPAGLVRPPLHDRGAAAPPGGRRRASRAATVTSGSEAGAHRRRHTRCSRRGAERLLTPLASRRAEACPTSSSTSADWSRRPRPSPAGTGPVAVDAERASGHRYGQKAYLVQLRRAGPGPGSIDPVACPDLGPVADGIGDAEWVLHAATQDLPCLAQIGLRPVRLFDTELGGATRRPASRGPRRRGRALPRADAGQGALGRRLVHPAAARALAALRRPRRRGPRRAARRDRRRPGVPGQERAGPARSSTPCSTSRGRRSGSTRGAGRRACTGSGKPRGIALVKELWITRDRIAERRDTSPGRVLPDSVIVELANLAPTTAEEMRRGPGAAPGSSQRQGLARRHPPRPEPARERPAAADPGRHRTAAARAWPDRDPVAAARLAQARGGARRVRHRARGPGREPPDPGRPPPRDLVTPADLSADGIGAALAALGARPWQVAITAPIVARGLRRPPLTS